MKKFYLIPLLLLLYSSAQLHAGTDIYSQSISKTGISLRGAPIILGSVNATFPSSGYVVVHFDGECYAASGDRIVLAASNTGDWGANDGVVAVETTLSGFGRPFSHTRVYSVSAGAHTYNAVAQNYLETDGTGMASIYGTLTVEYFPDNGTATVASKGFTFNGDVTNTKVAAEQTIHANAAGKIVVRFDGFITSDPGDRIVLAASNTTNWSFNDGNVAVEAVNEGDVDGNSYSHTRVYTVPSAGDYTYYAVSQVYGEDGGNHMVSINGNLLVEFFPDSNPEKILFDGFTLPEFDMNGQSTEITSITFNAPSAGKVMVGLDGYLTANEGYLILLAASNDGTWSNNDGSVTYQALDNDQNRYSFSHTRVYNVSAGSNTFYAVGQIFSNSGVETADLFGELTVKYIPNSTTAVTDLSTGKNSFEIYPNPSQDVVTLTFKNPIEPEKKIQLLDLNGCVLKEYQHYGKEDVKMDMSAFPADLYWIKVGNALKAVMKM